MGANGRKAGQIRPVTEPRRCKVSVTGELATTNLFLPDDLEDASRTAALAEGDLDALRAVAEWISAFVAKPHKDLGRAGPVCPFVPEALERHTLWMAAEHVAGRSTSDVADLISGYQGLFKAALPTDGGDAIYKSFVVVLPDLPADRAADFLDDVLGQLAVVSYEEDGFVMGPFYEGNQGTAIYNASFRPFTSPVPFVLMRQAVVGDWKFYLDDPDQLRRWARRYGEAGALALGEELRRLPWRAGAA
jgi:hypothetical protein